MQPDFATIEHAAGLAVMYHYVGLPPCGPFVGFRGPGATAFEDQVRRLATQFEPMDWPSYREHRQRAADNQPPAVLLTFDDGLRCQAETAARILETVGLRGVFFVSTAALTSPRLLDAHKLHVLLSHVSEEKLIEDIERALRRADAMPPPKDIEVGWRTVYHYEAPVRARLKYLVGHVLPAGVRRAVLEETFAKHVGDEATWAAQWYGDVQSWKALSDRGHTIGGHGHSHEPLAGLSEKDLLADLSRCAEILSEHFGDEPRPMSYPFGSVNSLVARCAKAAGFEAAFTTVAEGDTPDGDAMYIPRVDAKDVDMMLEKCAEVGACTR